MTDTIIELSEEAFDAQYPLRINHLNPSASWAYGEGVGCLFETYGDELAFVRSQNPRTVWTLIDGDDGEQYVRSGFHLVNRIGYLISTLPVPEGTTIQVHIPRQSEQAAEATAHTPEPWETSGNRDDSDGLYIVQKSTGGIICQIESTLGQAASDKANARRIVAAVNACKGISTEALEQGVVRQLMEALEDLYNWLTPDWQQSSLGDKARAAIDKATGRAT